MPNKYAGLSQEERLERICKILVRLIYKSKYAPSRKAQDEPAEATYNLRQAAYRLGISKRTLQRWITQRRFRPKMRKDRTYIITSDDLRNLRTMRPSV